MKKPTPAKGFYSIREVCEFTTLSRRTIQRLLKTELRSTKLGQRRLIPASELERLLTTAK